MTEEENREGQERRGRQEVNVTDRPLIIDRESMMAGADMKSCDASLSDPHRGDRSFSTDTDHQFKCHEYQLIRY